MSGWLNLVKYLPYRPDPWPFENLDWQSLQASMIKFPSQDEICKALFEMGSFEAPCPNGFQAHFYPISWHTDLKDVSKFTQTIFVTVIILHPLNHIQIILREFQLITSDSNNNFLLLDQDTNRFLV